VAVEVLCTTGLVIVTGEVTTSCYSDMNGVARRTIQQIGYHSPAFGFNGATCGVLVSIDEQSTDIAEGVFTSEEVRLGIAQDEYDSQGAGDQGMMFGYACRQSEAVKPGTFMPLPIFFAHELARRLAFVRKEEICDFLGPDGKTQVTVAYEDGQPAFVDRVLISTQHVENASARDMKEAVIEHVIKQVIPLEFFPNKTINPEKILVNPSGKFVKGGPLADTGLTGRKIIVDTYGGYARHGGGSFSGKDPSKVDRSGSYYARYAAKNLVAAGVADEVEISVAYAIGRARPLGISVSTFGTEKIPLKKLKTLVEESGIFDFRPKKIVDTLGLKAPIYRQVSAYGHFGRFDVDLPWERLDLVDKIRSFV
jgi:S-adenosylmethionine synthetase